MIDRLIKVSDLAHRTGYSPESFYKRIREGTLPGVVRLGRSIRLRESAIEAWLRGEARNKEPNSVEKHSERSG